MERLLIERHRAKAPEDWSTPGRSARLNGTGTLGRRRTIPVRTIVFREGAKNCARGVRAPQAPTARPHTSLGQRHGNRHHRRFRGLKARPNNQLNNAKNAGSGDPAYTLSQIIAESCRPGTPNRARFSTGSKAVTIDLDRAFRPRSVSGRCPRTMAWAGMRPGRCPSGSGSVPEIKEGLTIAMTCYILITADEFRPGGVHRQMVFDIIRRTGGTSGVFLQIAQTVGAPKTVR